MKYLLRRYACFHRSAPSLGHDASGLSACVAGTVVHLEKRPRPQCFRAQSQWPEDRSFPWADTPSHPQAEKKATYLIPVFPGDCVANSLEDTFCPSRNECPSVSPSSHPNPEAAAFGSEPVQQCMATAAREVLGSVRELNHCLVQLVGHLLRCYLWTDTFQVMARREKTYQESLWPIGSFVILAPEMGRGLFLVHTSNYTERCLASVTHEI